jgi:hypothetical protein
MLGLYYRIWVDFIKRAKQPPASRQNWKTGSMLFMTLAMASNLILIMTILERHVLKKTIYTIDFSFLPERANSVLSYIFLFILPCFIINYFLIFRNKRYLKLLELYPYYNGKLAASYCVISFMLPIVLLLIGFIFFR